MCRVIWLVVFQMCFFDFPLWVGMSVFSWLTLKSIIIWHGVAQPRFVGIQIGSRVQGRAATTICLMVDKVDSAKWGCWRILPTSDWLQCLGLFKIIVYWCLLFIFWWGCKLVALADSMCFWSSPCGVQPEKVVHRMWPQIIPPHQGGAESMNYSGLEQVVIGQGHESMK